MLVVAEVGEKIRRLRRERLMTQAQLGKQSGVATSTIARIELGEVEPQFGTLKKIATGLGVEPVELVRD